MYTNTLMYSVSVLYTEVSRNKVELCDTTGRYNTEGGSCLEAESILPLVIIFISQFIAGIGNILFFSLGGPYLDDNSKKKNMPMVFGKYSGSVLL
jgi:hypothetical protein